MFNEAIRLSFELSVFNMYKLFLAEKEKRIISDCKVYSGAALIVTDNNVVGVADDEDEYWCLLVASLEDIRKHWRCTRLCQDPEY